MNELSYIEYPAVIHVAPPAQYLKETAYRGEAMPEGLTSSAQGFFQKTRNLYKASIDHEQGKREMADMERTYESDERTEEANFAISQFRPRIEPAAQDYAHSPGTPEGDRFYAAVYGLPEDWRLKRGVS